MALAVLIFSEGFGHSYLLFSQVVINQMIPYAANKVLDLNACDLRFRCPNLHQIKGLICPLITSFFLGATQEFSGWELGKNVNVKNFFWFKSMKPKIFFADKTWECEIK